MVNHTRPATIKFLDENIHKTFSEINHSNVFLEESPKAKEILKKERERPNQIKLKSFSTAKETISKMKRQPTD